MGQATKYDDTLFAMMQQHENEMEFLNTVFGFLQRKSTCFNGPKVRSAICAVLHLIINSLEAELISPPIGLASCLWMACHLLLCIRIRRTLELKIL